MLSFQYNTIKFYEISPIKNEGSLLLSQNEVRADIFSGSLAVFQSERVASAGGRKGGLGGIPPALQILGEISSNFFESTPPDYAYIGFYAKEVSFVWQARLRQMQACSPKS